MLKVENLIYEYPNKRVLHGLNFVIEKGSITVLIGPNGAGKTTLIRCITGLTLPFAGNVWFNGDDVHLNPVKVHKNMGYLPDFFGLYDALSVEKCLYYAALSQNVPEEKINEAVAITAERLGLTDRIKDLAGDLSRGLRQKLAIGQAIIHKPDFLVLDEPASGLDPDARLELSKLFKQLKSEGMTLVVSSHILAELDDYATDMIVIKNGEIVVKKDVTNQASISSKRLMLKLVSDFDKACGILQNISNVSDIIKDEDGISFSFLGDINEQSDVLAKLVKNDLVVTEFKESNFKLHDAYIASINS
ncbi:MAG: ABC transporter ATP-binding protein [Alphaproteobacteria bacterium]